MGHRLAFPGSSFSKVELVCKRERPWGQIQMRNKKIEYNSKTNLDPKDQGPGSASIWCSSSFEGDPFSHQVEGQKAKFGS